MAEKPVLDVQGLTVRLPGGADRVNAVENVSFAVAPGEIVCVVGESGSGKSVTAHTIMGLLPPGQLTATGGRALLEGDDLLTKTPAEMRKIRGDRISMIFQEPMTALNPVMKVGDQIAEVLDIHTNLSERERRARVLAVMQSVHLPEPDRLIDVYPHQLSGGQRQRIMIAAALVLDPVLLIADEPTTALDVTIQAQILELIAEIQQRLGLAVLLVTHDLGVVAGVCNRVVVMYGGKIMERGPAADVFEHPGHPYSAGLLSSTPRLDFVQHRLRGIDGSPPNMIEPPPGCPFAPRCPIATERCAKPPPFVPAENGREVACWYAYDTDSLWTGARSAELSR